LSEPTTDKELSKTRPTAEKLQRADDLFKLSVKERRQIYGDGNLGLVQAGLCDGQKCINHAFLPKNRGCYCKLSRHDNYDHAFFRDKHIANCSLNGTNDTPEFDCPEFKGDPLQEYDRARPAYQQKIFARKVI